jgi:hypothetical protein
VGILPPMFSRHRIATAIAAALVAAAVLAPAWRVQAAIGDQLLPNLKATPATDIGFGTGALLRFSTLSWNAGTGPLDLRAGDTYPDGTQDVWQWIALEGGGWAQRLAGRFVWHPAHNHFHFEGYALYTLQPVDAAGGSARTGQKTTFCVMDTNHVNAAITGSPASGVYTTCGNVEQGMSVGWGDRYGYTLAGQGIDMTGMADGDYRLFIEIDPQHKLSESDRSDNISCVLLRVSVSARTVRVLNPNSCASETVTAITPTSARVGQSVSVTITGTGFAAGVAVSFANGNGAAPSVKNVVVVNDTTITATVTVPRKRMGSDPLWDVRVGSGALTNAFTVLA